MAICEWCNLDMLEVKHCPKNEHVIYPDGRVMLTRVYVGSNIFSRCHDCNVESVYKHHPGCDMEECPRCLGQLISCGCLDETKEVTHARSRRTN